MRAAIVTWPSRISAFSRERDSAGMRAASTRSSRRPASSAPMVTVSVAAVRHGFKQCPTTTRSPSTRRPRALSRKVRRLMMIASVTTFIAVAAVLAVIGYRVFTWRGKRAAALCDPSPPHCRRAQRCCRARSARAVSSLPSRSTARSNCSASIRTPQATRTRSAGTVSCGLQAH